MRIPFSDGAKKWIAKPKRNQRPRIVHMRDDVLPQYACICSGVSLAAMPYLPHLLRICGVRYRAAGSSAKGLSSDRKRED
jgi:hypothetical protein